MLTKIKNFIHNVLSGVLITGVIVLTAVNFSGNIALNKRAMLLTESVSILNDRINAVMTLASEVGVLQSSVNTHEIRIHDNKERIKATNYDINLELKAMNDYVDKTVKQVNKLIKIVRDNGEYCTRKGDIGCKK